MHSTSKTALLSQPGETKCLATWNSHDSDLFRPAAQPDGTIRPPLLTYPGKEPSNFVVFRKHLIVWFGARFGNFGSFVRTNTHYEPPKPVKPTGRLIAYPSAPRREVSAITRQRKSVKSKKKARQANFKAGAEDASLHTVQQYVEPDPEEVLIYRGQMKSYTRQIYDWKVKSAVAFFELWSLMSAASQSAVMHHPRYPEILERSDPVELWNTIRETHQGTQSGSSIADIAAANKRYYAVRQSRNESLDSYKGRIDAALDAIEAYGGDKPSVEVQASLYLDGLDDRRYAELKNRIFNDELRGIAPRPTTLHEAHTITTCHRTPVRVPNPAALLKRKRGDGKMQKPASSNKTCKLCCKAGHWLTSCPNLARAREAIAGITELSAHAVA